MATRSTISIERADGSISQIYCHWDGYLEGVGATLKAHYDTPEKIEALIALGAVSFLEPSIECPESHSFNNPVKGHTVFYDRDRGDRDCGARHFQSYNVWQNLNNDLQEYNYIFRHETQAWEYIT